MSIYSGLSLEDLEDATSEFLGADTDETESDFTEPENELRDVSADFVEERKETPTARKYRLKTKHGLNFLLNIFVQNEKTVADAATIVEYGPQVSRAVGELADAEPRVRKAIDFLTEDGIDNPYVLTVIAIMPMAFQFIRNHEKTLTKEIKPHIRIPFTKREIRLPFRFHFRIGFIKNHTATPEQITDHVFGNPEIRAAFEKRDIKIAWQPNYSRNGHRV